MKKKTKTTEILVNGQLWKVPRGFGAAYRREVARQMELFRQHKPAQMIDDVIDTMALVGYEPTRKAVADWPMRKRVEAIIYAATVHARAGDNTVRRHPDLPWLRDVVPWCGPPAERPKHIRPDLWGAFSGPTPTRISE